MDSFEFLKLTVTAVSGGTMGVIIKALIDRRARKAKLVARDIDVNPILPRNINLERPGAKMELTIAGKPTRLDKLFIASIRIWNTTGEDLEVFPFRLKFHGDKPVFWESKGMDISHGITGKLIDCNGASEQCIEFVCIPFNSEDQYFVQLFIEVPTDRSEAGEIHFSTSIKHKFSDFMKTDCGGRE